MTTKKEDLFRTLEYAKSKKSWGFYIETMNQDMKKTEIIIFRLEDFDYKKEYIDRTYDDNLMMKTFPKISIIDYDVWVD